MAKHILNSSDEEFDFSITGISCAEEQYSAAAIVDEALSIKLRLSEFVPFTLKEGKIFNFSLYKYYDEELGLSYSFIPNVSNFEEPNKYTAGNDLFSELQVDESVRLIRELPKTDYFLLLKGEDILNYQFKILEKLKKTEGIIQATAIDARDLPSRRNLIF